MAKRLLISVSFVVLLGLAGCGGSSEVTFQETTTPDVVLSPTARPTRSVIPTLRPYGSPKALGTTVPTGSPLATTPTADAPPSAALSRAAGDIDDKLDDFRAAVRDGDNQRALSLQRELLADADKAEQTARSDKTKYGEQMLAALSMLRAGLAGDLSKLDGAKTELEKIAGRSSTPSGTPGKDATSQPIDNLGSFAGKLADKTASFEKALASNDTSTLLSLQSDILADIDKADTQLKDSRSKQADLIRSAIGDLRAGMAGETNKLASAEAKLREAAGQNAQSTQTAYSQTTTPAVTGTPVVTPSPNASPSAQPNANTQQLAGDLKGKLDNYARALQDNSNPQNTDQAKKDLQDQLGKTESALQNDNSTQASQLRSAIGQIREALGGDTAKIESARKALDAVGR